MRSSRPAAAALALVVLAPVATHAVAEAAGAAAADDRSLRISLWGVPVADDDGAGWPPGRRAGSSVAIERSRWSESGPNRARLEQLALADRGGQARTGVDVTDVSYRWGMSSARESLDVGIGAGAYRLRSGAHPLGPAGTVADNPDVRRDIFVPTVSVGVRRSLSQQHRVDLYASGTAGMASPAVGEFYTAKVKVEWLPTKNSGLGFEQSAINMRFGPNSNFALRVRNRGPVIYYRAKF